MYNRDFDKLIAQTQGQQFLEDFKKTYYYSKLFNVIFDNNIYVEDYKKSIPKYRLTFPFFIIAVMLINITMCINWIFTGTAQINHKSWVARKMIQWDKACNFNIVA